MQRGIGMTPREGNDRVLILSMYLTARSRRRRYAKRGAEPVHAHCRHTTNQPNDWSVGLEPWSATVLPEEEAERGQHRAHAEVVGE